MRYVMSALLVTAVFVAVTVVNSSYGATLEPTLYNYMIVHFEEDTAAHNAIAAILLNYRMYDTMFEALILLTAIVGMKQFLPASHELKNTDAGEKRRV